MHTQQPCWMVEDGRAGGQARKRAGGCKGMQACRHAGACVCLLAAHLPLSFCYHTHGNGDGADGRHTTSMKMITGLGIGVQAVVSLVCLTIWNPFRAGGHMRLSVCLTSRLCRQLHFVFVCAPISWYTYGIVDDIASIWSAAPSCCGTIASIFSICMGASMRGAGPTLDGTHNEQNWRVEAP